MSNQTATHCSDAQFVDATRRLVEKSTYAINHSSDIVISISQLFGNELYSDVRLIVQGVSFPAHRAVLAARSDYFRALLYGGMAESSSSVVFLNDINLAAFRQVLNYIYTGRLKFSKVKLSLDILGLAHQYNFRSLEDAIATYLTQSLNLHNIWSVYNLAVTYNLKSLINACLKFMDSLAPMPLYDKRFLKLSYSALELLLSRDSFCASEIEIFRAICSWFKSSDSLKKEFNTTTKEREPSKCNECELVNSGEMPNQITTVENIDQYRDRLMLNCVRFELMSLTDLLNEVRSSKLLSSEVLLDAINCQTNCSSALPHRGWLLPGFNLASPRCGCKLIAGEGGTYPYFFVDDLMKFDALNSNQLKSNTDSNTNTLNTTFDTSVGVITNHCDAADDDDVEEEDGDDVDDADVSVTLQLNHSPLQLHEPLSNIDNTELNPPSRFGHQNDECGVSNLCVQLNPQGAADCNGVNNATIDPGSSGQINSNLGIQTAHPAPTPVCCYQETGTISSSLLSAPIVISDTISSTVNNNCHTCSPTSISVNASGMTATSTATSCTPIAICPNTDSGTITSITSQTLIDATSGVSTRHNAFTPRCSVSSHHHQCHHHHHHHHRHHHQQHHQCQQSHHSISRHSISHCPHIRHCQCSNSGQPRIPNHITDGGQQQQVYTVNNPINIATHFRHPQCVLQQLNCNLQESHIMPANINSNTTACGICLDGFTQSNLNMQPNITTNSPPPHSEHDVVRHSLDDPKANIVISLGKSCIVNTIRMQLWDRDIRSYSYTVDVSLDQTNWQCVVDYRNYLCRSWQILVFPARALRYIRITGTRSTHNRSFHLITFRCFYSEQVFPQIDRFLIPNYNVATVDNGATVLEGVSRNRNSLIDGNIRVYDWNSGYTCHQLGNGAIVVQLAQPFFIRSMRFLLWDLDSRSYSYSVFVSNDRVEWKLVRDATREQCQSWQLITFPLQLVTFVRIVGSYNTANEVFHLVHLECPYPPIESSGLDEANSTSLSTHDHDTVNGSSTRLSIHSGLSMQSVQLANDSNNNNSALHTSATSVGSVTSVPVGAVQSSISSCLSSSSSSSSSYLDIDSSNQQQSSVLADTTVTGDIQG